MEADGELAVKGRVCSGIPVRRMQSSISVELNWGAAYGQVSLTSSTQNFGKSNFQCLPLYW